MSIMCWIRPRVGKTWPPNDTYYMPSRVPTYMPYVPTPSPARRDVATMSQCSYIRTENRADMRFLLLGEQEHGAFNVVYL